MRVASIASGSDWCVAHWTPKPDQGPLITHGIRALRITDAKWCERLAKMQTGDVGQFRRG